MCIEQVMITKKITSNPSEELKEALEWYCGSEDSSEKEIMVDIGVYNNAEKMSKRLNTNVGGVLCLCAYRTLKDRSV